MANTALASLRHTLEKITLSQQDQNTISPPHNQQIRSIHEQVIFLQQFADDSPEKVFFYEGRVRNVSHEAEYVVENFIKEQIRSRFRLTKCIGLLAKFGKRKPNFNQQLQKIREEFESIALELMEIENNGNISEDDDELQLGNSLSTNWSSPSLIAEEVMERETIDYLQVSDLASKRSSSTLSQTSGIQAMDSLGDDLLAIKTRLCGGSPKLQVIPVVGMGGIGKTTLARNVHDDPLTIQYFDIRAWVTVSQDYSRQKIVLGLVDSMKEFFKKRSGQSDEEAVYKGLKGRRYLIVMDDVWSTNVWDDVRYICPDDNNGSRIMITTRLSDVAAYFDSRSPLHEMRLMSDEQSWELIRQRVLGDEYCCPQLENIGKKIAQGCRGLPLASVVIAGILSTVKRKPDSWWEIAENVSSIVATEDDGQFDEILSLSYTHLPNHLRSCFLYMGGFPEDHEIRISKLVKLWVADGFLIHSEGSSKSLEEEGEECLEDLANRNLVLVTKRKSNGRIKSCSLHDLIRDLCIRKAQESNFFLNLIDRYVEEQHLIEIIKDQHRISVESSRLRYLSSTYCPTIHTIMCFNTKLLKDYPVKMEFLKSVGLLRVLDAENTNVESLPDVLFKLIHLRYVSIQFMFGFTIPAAISKLQNLQTLVIDAKNRQSLIGRPDVECLPQEIWMMSQLRHLICYGRFPHPEDTTSTLENLQTLSLVLHEICVEGIIEKIPNIRKLGIDCSYYDYGAHLKNLVYLHQLQSLELCNADWRKESVCFPRMLRKLTLRNMSLPWSEMSIVGCLPNLQVLKLRDFACIGSTWETAEEEFPELQSLLIETSKLQHWITESNHFPRLKFLLLHECMYMDEIPQGFGEIATLELIEIKCRNFNSVTKSLVETAKRILEEQQSFGNDALQVHYPLNK